MADLSNSSFIPKRGPVKQKKRSSSRKVYIFTLVSYTLMFATLLGAGGVYLYSNYIDRLLETEVTNLYSEIRSFDEAQMLNVQDFNARLSQASDRIDNSVSVGSIFSALEAATIGTVKIDSLSLVREFDEKFLLNASIQTDSFDSTIFQRGVFTRNNEVVTSVAINNLRASGLGGGLAVSEEDGDEYTAPVTFDVELEIPISTVPYTVIEDIAQPLTITEPEAVFTDGEQVDSLEDDEVLEDNQTDI
ncbi:hypothetical protein H6787_02860 [Candidatus Nomurabacteria bacterium]|nr:hypothetical protein [Candidatus Nomurabacteria bacterium]